MLLLLPVLMPRAQAVPIPQGACVDSDGDGLCADDEDARGTSDDDADSDDDGVDDGDEVAAGLDPTARDSDGDGLQDGTELGVTSPGPDTDLATFVPDADPDSTTDPLVADTDGGGVPDGLEDFDRDGAVGPGETDPNDPDDDFPDAPDSDGDGVPDDVERQLGMDPANADSDGDGLIDGIDGVADSDGDGLVDALDPDSDDDGIPDGLEDLDGDGVLDPGETDPKRPDQLQGACACATSGPEGVWWALLAVAVSLRRRR